MKILWQVSFRPLNKSEDNDNIQKKFLKNISKLNLDITLSVTQFGEEGIENLIKEENLKFKYFNFPKNKLPKKKKYSNSIMLKNSLEYYLENKFDYFIFSNSDVIINPKISKILKSKKPKNYMGFIYPNILIKNGYKISPTTPHYGIDFIAFKLSKEKASDFLNLVSIYEQYDWGLIDNFYIACADKLKLNTENLFKKTKLIKYENKFSDFNENRIWQIKSWNENFVFFKRFINKNKLSTLYLHGSYYFLLLKLFKIKDLNFDLFIVYVRLYFNLPFHLIKKFFLNKPNFY